MWIVRTKLLVLLLALCTSCVPSYHGVYQDLPLPPDAVSREAERSARLQMQKGEEAAEAHEWQAAEKHFLEALAIRKTIFGVSSSYVDEVYLRLVGVFLQQGDLNRSLPILSKLRRSVLDVRSDDPVIRAELAFDTASIFNTIGHTVYADELFRESLRLRRQFLGESHIDTKITEFWMTQKCGTGDRPSFSDERLLSLIDDLEKALDRENPSLQFVNRHASVVFCTWLRAYHVMATRLIKQHNIKQLYRFLDNGSSTIGRWFRDCSPLIDYKEMEAEIYASIGELERAKYSYLRAMEQANRIASLTSVGGVLSETMRRRLRWSQLRQISLLEGLASVELLQKDLASAEARLIEANAIIGNANQILDISARETEKLFDLAAALAEIRWARHNYPLAEATWLYAMELFESRFRRIAADQTEFGLLMKVSSVRQMAHSIYSILSAMRSSIERQTLVRLAWTSALLSHGRVTEEMAKQLAPLNLSLSSGEMTLWRQLVSLRMRYAALEYKTNVVNDKEIYEKEKRVLLTEEAELQMKLRRLENPTIQLIRDIPSVHQLLPYIQANLPANGVLVHYVQYKHINQFAPQNSQSNTLKYLALILHHDGQSDAIDLGNADVINRHVMSLHSSLRNPTSSYTESSASQLYDLVVRPLLPLIRTGKTLYIVPDGDLHLIPFFMLRGSQGLLGDEYDIRYLSSGRDLIPAKAQRPATDVIVFANPDLDSVPESSTESADAPPAALAASPYTQSRALNLRRTPTGLMFDGLGSLQSAEKEAADIQEIYPQSKIFLSREASEQKLTMLTRPPGILHFATHGAFLRPTELESDTDARGYLSRAHESPPANPLLRSMLLLAGARRGRLSASSLYDGLATALELSSIPLHGTQMVVLSACESGLGEVAPGEGVAGLRQAFLVAGAETVVASLWKVDDGVTRELMRSFYRYLRAGEGRSSAMHHAAQQIRNHYPHPYYWASFIVIGESGSLRGFSAQN